MKAVIRLAVAIGALGVLSACAGNGRPYVAPSAPSTPSAPAAPSLVSIQVSGASASLIAGQSQQLKAIGTYNNGTNQDLTSSVTWSTSNNTVAAVVGAGLLNARTSGQCTVLAQSGTVRGSFNLSVSVTLVSIAITPPSATIAAGTTQQFVATGTYNDGSTQNLTTSVTWSSSNTAFATVSSSVPTMGLSRSVTPGSLTIQAALGSVAGTASLTVSSATATSISVTPSNPTLPLAVTQQFTATATFSDNSVQDVSNVAHWGSSSNIARITTSGLVTSTNVGTSNISASFGGVSGASLLTVNAANVASISIQPTNASIAQGTKLQFTATGTFNDGSTRDITHAVTWSSSDTTILKIGSSSGIGLGITAGFVNVSATLGGSSVSVPINVTNATIMSISLTPGPSTIPTGAQQLFSAIGTFSDSSTQDISTIVAWSSDNTSVSTVGNTSANYGLASALSAGTAHVSATFSYAGASSTGSTPLTVSSATLTSISLTPTTALLAPASGVQFTATGNFSDGSTFRINPSVVWSTSDNSIATTNPTGWVTGQNGGAVTVSAKSGSVVGTAQVLVESATLASLQVTPANGSGPAGIALQLHATGSFTNGDTLDLTNFVTWTSSNATVATISNAQSSAGAATGSQPGTSTISAVFAGQAGTANLNITNATLTSIEVTPGDNSIAVGSTVQLFATGNFSDGTTFDLTEQANWSSSDTSVVTIIHGVAAGVKSGSVTISATQNGVTGTAIVAVQ